MNEKENLELEEARVYLKAAGYNDDDIKLMTNEPYYKFVRKQIEVFKSYHQETLVPSINRLPVEERTPEMEEALDPLNAWRQSR